MSADYSDLVAAMSPSTMNQRHAFVSFVANAHSWYKKLPLIPPGEPFFLFLDPHNHEAFYGLDGEPPRFRRVVRVDAEHVNPMFRSRLRMDGDDSDPPGLAYSVYKLTTAEFRARYGHWSYWNWGRPGQPRSDALAAAAADLRVRDDDGREIPIHPTVLDLGLVYLRATISPDLGPAKEEYEAARNEHDLPSHEEDRTAQVAEMIVAMGAVADWVAAQRDGRLQ